MGEPVAALLDWKGKVAPGPLLRETLRSVSRQPFTRIMLPGLLVGAWIAVGERLQHVGDLQGIAALAVTLLVGMWAWAAQNSARARRPWGVCVLSMGTFAMLAGGIILARRFGSGWEPFIVLLPLTALFVLAIPAAAVDGVRPKVMLRDSWNAGRGSLPRIWVGLGILGVAHGALLALVGAGSLRLGWGNATTLAALGLVVGSGLGSSMTLSSIAYLELRNLRRVSDVSSWVEVFR